MKANFLKLDMDDHLSLVKVKKINAHIEILYDLILKRQMNISHQSKPTYDDHQQFVLNNPYRIWFLVKFHEEYIGSVYILKNNCIGINVNQNRNQVIPWIINTLLRKYKPLKALKSVRAANFDINVAPDDKEYADILESMGARLMQYTYAIPVPDSKSLNLDHEG